MGVLNIITEPNELLRKTSKTIMVFDTRLHELLDDMAKTMVHNGGIGLAGVQVGVLYRICVVDTERGIVELINPEIISSKKVKKGEEGCISVPNQRGIVERAHEVVVRAQNRNGKTFEHKFTGIDAVCVAHEIDHMDGILYFDRIKS